MEIKTSRNSWLDIFGSDSTGSTAWQRATNSSVCFVRSQDELSISNLSAKGRTFKAKEALSLFGEDCLRRIWEEGSAILPSSPTEPARTLRDRREALGLTQTDLHRLTKIPLDIIAKAESPDYSSKIFDLSRLAAALGVDDAVLGFRPDANGDKLLAIRLKAWRSESGATPNTIAKLSAITWIINAQHRFQKWLTPNNDPLEAFAPNNDYGNAYYPAWDVAHDLARETRRLLNFSYGEPIPSLREICHRLQIPLIHAELPTHIAGATLATGNLRGIVVNVSGNDNNVWVQRATVAHELGHLLWDPNESLNSLIVDNKDQVERIDRKTQNWVEARANAFAVELIAPREAIRDANPGLDVFDPEAVQRAIRESMEYFGLSLTAMRYHLWNAFEREFDFNSISHIDPVPSDEWNARERYTDDYFPISTTPLERRGEFASLVVRATRENWMTEDVAAFYLDAPVDMYRDRMDEILSLYPD